MKSKIFVHVLRPKDNDVGGIDATKKIQRAVGCCYPARYRYKSALELRRIIEYNVDKGSRYDLRTAILDGC